MHVLHDGDVLLYQAGFASDAAARKRLMDELLVKYEGNEEDAQGAYEDYVAQYGPPFEPLENSIYLLKLKLQALNEKCGATKHTVYLSHPVNWREEIFPEYKANRDALHKPHWYNECHEYLLNRGALYAKEGDEADDALGIAQMELLRAGKPSLICTIDKDLDMIPGMHYNYGPSRYQLPPYEVGFVEGDRFFHTQLLVGDGTDNIPGMWKILGKRATKQYTAPIQRMDNPREMYEHVLNIYRGDEAQVELLANLLWIKREDARWKKPE